MEHGLRFRALLAEALMKDELSDEGLVVVNEALNAALSAGGFHFLAELYRLKGELLLQR